MADYDYTTRTQAIAATIPSGFEFIRTVGYRSVGDGGGALHKKVSSAPSHQGKFQSADGAWWEISEMRPDIRMFGAYGDSVSFQDGAMTSGNANLTSLSSVFSSSDVGKVCAVYGAGSAGAHLETTIAAYVSVHVVTLSTAASTTVSSALGYFGHDDTTAISDAKGFLQSGGSLLAGDTGRAYLTGTVTFSAGFPA